MELSTGSIPFSRTKYEKRKRQAIHKKKKKKERKKMSHPRKKILMNCFKLNNSQK